MKDNNLCNKKEFSRDDTKIIKGVAVVLMLMHHLWFFPDRIAGGELKHLFTIFGESSLGYFGSFGKICVSLFFFLGGYGIYIQSRKENFNLINNIKKLFTSYWKVFLIFIPIAFIFFSNQIPYAANDFSYARYNSFSWSEVIKNFFTFSCTLNGEWWFLNSYLFAIISFPIIKQIISKFNSKYNIIIVIAVLILGTYVFPAIGNISKLGTLNNNYFYYNFLCKSFPWVACFWMGAVFAKDDLLIKFYNKINNSIHLNIIIDFLIIMAIIFFREQIVAEELDILYAQLLSIIFIDLADKLKIIKFIFYKLGCKSTNMFLIHSFYCYYFGIFAKITTYFKWGIPCLLVLIVMTYISSVILDFFWDYVFEKYNCIKNSLRPKRPETVCKE